MSPVLKLRYYSHKNKKVKEVVPMQIIIINSLFLKAPLLASITGTRYKVQGAGWKGKAENSIYSIPAKPALEKSGRGSIFLRSLFILSAT